MQGIITALKESNLFCSIDVIELIDEDTIKLLKLKARVTDGTLLYITELHSPPLSEICLSLAERRRRSNNPMG